MTTVCVKKEAGPRSNSEESKMGDLFDSLGYLGGGEKMHNCRASF